MSEPSSALHVAVGIVGFRNVGDITTCLEALGRSTHRDFEVIICENGGEEAYGALVASAPERLPGGQPVRVVQAPGNIGFAGGVNRCLAETPAADAWWVLNPDTLPHPEALAAMVDRLSKGDCDAVGCTLYLPHERVQSHGGRWRPWLARAESIGNGDPLATPADPEAIERRQSYLNGACMLVSRRFVQTAGLMREEYFLYCEEVEWCIRACARGLRLGFAAGALVLHEQGTTTGAREDMTRRPRLPVYLNERNRILLTRDCFPAKLPFAAVAALGLIVLKYGRQRAFQQMGYAIAGWAAGLRDERGPPAWLGAAGG